MPLPDVVVVGGGAIGCSIAYHLSKAGAQVLIIEKEEIGSQASRAAAGMLVPLAEATGPSPFLDLGLASLRRFPSIAQELKEESGIDIEFVPSGVLVLALSDEDEKELKSSFEWQKNAGLAVEWLSADDVRQLEPALSPQIGGGVHSRQEGHVSGLRLTQAFAQAAVNRGATLSLGTKATGLITRGARVSGVRLLDEEISAGHVVLATGAWTGMWREWLGPDLPIFPVRGQILAVHQLPVPLRRCIYGGHQGYLVPKADGTVIVGATQEQVGFDSRVTTEGIGYLLNMAPQLVPALADATFCRAWACLRPGSGDDLPLLGSLPDWHGLTLAAGHFRNGILLSPITGQLIAELLIEERTSMPLTPFDPGRFTS
ncbi:MAG: glycine oxidase ThiO [Anaerolineae bacterium]